MLNQFKVELYTLAGHPDDARLGLETYLKQETTWGWEPVAMVPLTEGDLLVTWGRENPDGKPEPVDVAQLRRDVRGWTRMKMPDDTVITVPLGVLRQALGEEAT